MPTSSFKATYNIEVLLNEIVQGGIQNGVIPSRFLETATLATGTSDGQINKGYYVRETGIGSGVTTVYDLIGSLKDTSQATINFDEVVLIAIKNLGTTATQYLTIGPDATNGFGVVASNKGFWVAAIGSGGGSIIPADGGSWSIFHCYGGVPAAAGSTDELAVVTQAVTGNSWDLIILGRDN
jgi:hypothetical protein